MWFVIIPLSLLMIGLNFYVTWFTLRWSYNMIWPTHQRGSRFGAMAVPFNVIDDKIVGLIAMGTPNDEMDQMFHVAFNTMTAKFWLRSVEMCEGRDCTNEQFTGFDGTKSDTYVRKDKTFTQKYGQNLEVNGFVAEDTVRFFSGDIEFYIEKQEFGEINSITGNLNGIDGILGLGLVSPSDNAPHKGIVWTLLEQTPMEAVFGIYIHTKQHEGEDGRLIVGGKDQDLSTGPVNVHNVIKSNDDKYTGWIIPIKKAVIQFKGADGEDIQLSADTATPAPMLEEISVPESDLNPLLDKIFARADFSRVTKSFKCSSDWNKLPDLSLVIDDVSYILHPEDYVVPVDGESCMVAISSAGGSESIRLGRVFMKKYYTRFNIGSKQIQFIQAIPIP